ncbi:hypothetical protein P175DRAFT_0502431 [Aspergillus ochraceoroseus IBT 24754]|uniref:DUF7137 domain-containing protein n=3 Tax=Aspergillus subgen. Nidulantes TaxID=2720870 RepID=A0A0F8XS88_9EURO|nr:uncharacterized protein P175DRAFT_0502431 [Aspergillus ochraceoroseus IBT 24754]KKK18536.1 hypothetical protein AOCH_000758 [Aspergillus ochraceoroseus]KKK26392.1 hypothetical protein ARAM_002190 [Aspergillus rambellii]PTU20279.1 hypothetical protein P175DRAFT_0502431 [Aspergillus ochraceoroseus IBT 24754]
MRFISLFPLACLLLLAVLSTAWQFDGLERVHGQLLPREDSTTSTESATTGASASEETASATSTKSSKETSTETSSGTSSETTDSASTTTTSKHSGHSTSSKNSTTTSTSVDARLPAGGISMLTPSAISTTYYKIDEAITFVWNYTSLSITPTGVNVVASCSLNDATYTIASNLSVSQTQSVVWDTKKYQANATVPLLTASYTLIVYDESKSISDVASAGELGTDTRYYFAMYATQAYTPLADWVCATCSGAFTTEELRAMKFAAGMAVITVASFTWFAGSSGLFFT